jgi:hypothetical protein
LSVGGGGRPGGGGGSNPTIPQVIVFTVFTVSMVNTQKLLYINAARRHIFI